MKRLDQSWFPEFCALIFFFQRADHVRRDIGRHSRGIAPDQRGPGHHWPFPPLRQQFCLGAEGSQDNIRRL